MQLSHHHTAIDYRPGVPSDSCAPCGEVDPLETATAIDYLALTIKRRHRYRDQTWISSFGPGVYCNYDAKLKFYAGTNTTYTGLDGVNYTQGVPASDLPTGAAVYVHYFDPTKFYYKKFRSPVLGKYVDDDKKALKELRLIDRVTQQSHTNQTLTEALSAVVVEWNGTERVFDVIDTGDGSVEYHGRLAKIVDKTGHQLTITYQDELPNGHADKDFDTSNLSDALGQDRNRKWLIHKITDPFGREAVFRYHTTKKSGRWVVRQIDLPNGEVVTYDYNGSFPTAADSSVTASSGLLSQVNHADQTTSTFSYGTPSQDTYQTSHPPGHPFAGFTPDKHYFAGTQTITYEEAAAHGTHRNKTVTYSAYRYKFAGGTGKTTLDRGNAPWLNDAANNRVYVYTAGALLVRKVANGASETTYMNIPHAWGGTNSYVYEGHGRMRFLQFFDDRLNQLGGNDGEGEWSTVSPTFRYLKAYPGSPNAPSETADFPTTPVAGDIEEFYESSSGGNSRTGIYSSTTDVQGNSFTLEHDNNGTEPFVTEKEYSDSSTETWEYNKYKQVTRYKDRLGNVTLYDYEDGETGEPDTGNLWKMEVGLAAGSGGSPDTQTSAHAVYYWRFNGATGNGSHLLFKEYEPVEDSTPLSYTALQSTDPTDKFTQYSYTSNHQINAVLKPDVEGAGTQLYIGNVYDAERRLIKVVDAETRSTEYEYDERDRVTKITYRGGGAGACPCGPDTTKEFLYGTTTADANLLVAEKDRNGNVTVYQYDAAGRKSLTAFAAGSVGATGTILNSYTVPTVFASTASIETCKYLDGTELESECVVNGETTRYEYDYRHRLIKTTVFPTASKTLTSTRFFSANNLLIAEEDYYGRKNLYDYRDADSALVRSIRETIPGGSGISVTQQAAVSVFNSIEDQLRDTSDDPDFLIDDKVLDAVGRLIAQVGPRGYVDQRSYDSRNRVTELIESAQLLTGHTSDDADLPLGTGFTSPPTPLAGHKKTTFSYFPDNSIERVEYPRYHDASDTHGDELAFVEYTYDRRNQLRTASRPEGNTNTNDTVLQTETFKRLPDGKLGTQIDFEGNSRTSYYSMCCGRMIGQSDDSTHGSLGDRDGNGNVVHTATVEDLRGAESAAGRMYNQVPQNPDPTKTLREATRRYDGRNRVIAETKWLVPLTANVDPQAPPIAGDSGFPAADGLTTFTLYTDSLDDQPVLAGDTLAPTVDLTKVRSALSSEAGIAFDGTPSQGDPVITGSAMAVVNPEGEVQYTIFDSIGRVIAAGYIDTANGNPITLEIVKHEVNASSSGVLTGDLLETDTIVAQEIDSAGVVTESRWTRESADADGRVRMIERESEESTADVSTYTHDPNGNVKSFEDANDVGWDGVYDLHDRLTTRTDSYGDVVSYEYDLHDNVTVETDAKGNPTTTVYDTLDRRLEITDRVGGKTKFAYDKVGNLLEITDADATDAGGGGEKSVYTYDVRYNRTSEAMPGHDDATSVGHADYDKQLFKHDPARRLVRRTDQLGETVQLVYDMADRLERREYRDQTNSGPETDGVLTGPVDDQDTFVNDGVGRLTSATSDRYDNVCVAEYDKAGRKTLDSIQLLVAGYGITGDPTYETRAEYDAASRVTKITYPDGKVQNRTYTTRDRLDVITYDGLQVEDRDYDAGGRPTLRSAANGIDSTYAYRVSGANKDDLLASITRTGLSGADYTYGYDANKNRQSGTISAQALGGLGLDTQDYGYSVPTADGYDDEDRLVEWNRTDSNRDLEWTLSKAGDWKTYKVEGSTESRSHTAAHEIVVLSFTPHDAKGNLTGVIPGASGRTFEWDFDNRLKKVVVGATSTTGIPGTHEYTYDALGRRVSKHTSVGDCATTKRTLFACFGDQVMAEYGQACSGGSLDAPVQAAKYAYGEYIDEVVVQIAVDGTTEKRYYYHQDGLYSVVALTNQAGAVVNRYAYDAYGNPTSFSAPSADINGDGKVDLVDWDILGQNMPTASGATLATGDVTGDGAVDLLDLDLVSQQFNATVSQTLANDPSSNPYGFTGRRWGPESGIYFYRARYYEPLLGRFLSRDPVGYEGSPWNLYEYVGSQPLDQIDPTGLWWRLPSWLRPWRRGPKPEKTVDRQAVEEWLRKTMPRDMRCPPKEPPKHNIPPTPNPVDPPPFWPPFIPLQPPMDDGFNPLPPSWNVT